MKASDNCILIGGYSQPPRDTGVSYTYNTLACQLLINKKSHCITDCHFNLPSPLTNEYLKDILFGWNLDEDMEPLFIKIRKHLHLSIVNSVCQALRNAQERYREIDFSSFD